MMYDFSNTSFALFRALATHGNRLTDDLRLSVERVKHEQTYKPEASNAEQSEEVCYQIWRFTSHSQGMNAYK